MLDFTLFDKALILIKVHGNISHDPYVLKLAATFFSSVTMTFNT